MAVSNITHIKSISAYHRLRGLPEPEHPLVSVVRVDDFAFTNKDEELPLIMDYYSISLKRNCGWIRYGRQSYDYDTGVMYFVAPGQLFTVQHKLDEPKQSGWMLLVHPDLIWNTALANTIHKYEYFGYEVNEALWVSEKEESIIVDIMQNIHSECQANLDKFSKQIIITQIEGLLSYAERFYHRQFITREKSSHEILTRLETFLNHYFEGEQLVLKGPPSVGEVASELNISANYLSSLLRIHTGLNTQQHIQQRLIDKAKEKLSTTNLSISEIAYELGFEHLQSFSKLFKSKTQLSPKAFRRQFRW